jgi:glycerate dehydrogenase
MNIVILDAHCANPGDLSWEALSTYGNVTLYDRTSPEELIERCLGADIICTNKVEINQASLAQLPKLKMISVLATGTNVIDIKAAKQKGVIVSNVPAYSTESVVQHVFASILHFSSRIDQHHLDVQKGTWQHGPDFSFLSAKTWELHGKTMGIVGLGAIGQRVSSVAHAFGMKVLGTSRTPKDLPHVEQVTLDALLSRSDVISLHCPLSPETEHLINAKRLSNMKSNAILINTGRGGLVHEDDLAKALQQHQIAGAAVDVLNEEPPRHGSPLIGIPQCVITPHIAWATLEARSRLIDITSQNIASYLAGHPIHTI